VAVCHDHFSGRIQLHGSKTQRVGRPRLRAAREQNIGRNGEERRGRQRSLQQRSPAKAAADDFFHRFTDTCTGRIGTHRVRLTAEIGVRALRWNE
jgi:hypothetical protein